MPHPACDCSTINPMLAQQVHPAPIPEESQLNRESESSKRVAIVGAGPGGLAAARYLLAHGFEPVLFEQSDDIGGQWNAKGAHSGVWPNMRANSTRVMTYLSDL